MGHFGKIVNMQTEQEHAAVEADSSVADESQAYRSEIAGS
jgi:hypothetical protein